MVPVRTRPTFSFGPAMALVRNFQAGPPAARRDFDMTPGGEILGFITPGGAVTAPSEIRLLILNWFQEVASKAPRR